MKYIIATLGCKVNQYETQAMESFLAERGFARAVLGEIADAVIVNTCAVTAESGRKSRQLIRRLRAENPGAVLAVCGCYSQIEPDAAAELGADVIFGAAERRKLVDAVVKACQAGEGAREIDEPFKRRAFEALPAGAAEHRTRAMLKIQDGCVNFCTYCIIPYTRGRLRSLPLADAARETARLDAEGFREIVLTGIEVASYGVDLPGRPGLADVIETVAANAPHMRIRLGSLEPTVITEDFCRRLQATGKLCRHFHLSLQSGCDRTLKAMNRKYDTATFYEKTELLRKYFPGCALTGDLITGFPGETDADDAETSAFLQKCRFAAMHVFPYSRRPGTPADEMPGQLSRAVKEARARGQQRLCDTLHREYLDSSVGEILPVLFESEEDGFSIGHSDTYLLVKVQGTGLRGELRDVRIESAEGDTLRGALQENLDE
ncbi:MAG: tRNA (N(6)-L-threonylcarbamoyladenosine(37)-C(2))-methylthiotransferase MtaB [Oscillospiraceae bacterium]|nr:tRNA (N(6)-L-threonylcarbamoyladenosine(37)-C(2))-methylthiotransferase MtaB [Oscillospiraceae bacterium]